MLQLYSQVPSTVQRKLEYWFQAHAGTVTSAHTHCTKLTPGSSGDHLPPLWFGVKCVDSDAFSDSSVHVV